MHMTSREFIEAGLEALDASVRDKQGDLRNIQLATVSPAGHPAVRTLVLRRLERSPPVAEMHSDARADKVRDIANDGRVMILAWSAEEHLQLRFEGTAVLHRDDDVARSCWDALSANARNTYGLRAASGTPIEDPEGLEHLPEQEQYEQFTVILVSLASVDILRLEPEGRQTRAIGRFTADGMTASWVAQ